MLKKALRRCAAALVLGALSARPVAAREPDAKQAAKAHFDAGNALLARGEVAAALGEFQRSRALFPSRGNTLNAAIALQRLGRFDEALELYLSLPRDYELDREQRARVEREVELLRALTGKLAIRTEAGVSISIDGRDRGTAPFEQPLLVLGGSHVVRAHLPEHTDFEQRVEIVTGSEQELVVELARAEAPAPVVPARVETAPAPVPVPLSLPPAVTKRPAVAPLALVLGADLGPALGFGFGGVLSDACHDPCRASVPVGFSARVRGGYRLLARTELGLELGYLRLAGSYAERLDTLEPRGSGLQLGAAHDELASSAWSLGAYAGWTGEGRLHARASLGLGLSFARIRDERRGRYSVNPDSSNRYEADVTTAQNAHGQALYVAPELGLGLSIAPRVELALGVVLVGSIVVKPARFARQGVVVENAEGDPELAYLPEAELTGSAFFTLAPRLGVSARF